ncbi:uncharacterized protein LOC130657803 [Hydractinia symbiolongicarpus]|uniref:uncharacterized protein LOC130657803 n=1 Tax=Hydractinia symbiolongicarpus TaxID=13093 RepID=UPI00254CA16B|nr:uncharacterized protein LOC130657803 [Hydractinia symbiolongicarpus]
MVKQLGLPTFFMTLSCDDLRWNELISIIAQLKGENMTDDDIDNMSLNQHFDFNLIQLKKETRVVCFSPEKRKLFSEISTSENGSGCEIKKYKRGNGDDIIINDWSSVKKAKLSFTAPIIAKKYLTIAQINNECSLYDLVNTEACLYNLSNEKLVEKDGITIRLKQASINDKTNIIPITIFGDLVDKVEDKTVYCFGNLRVSKYQ